MYGSLFRLGCRKPNIADAADRPGCTATALSLPSLLDPGAAVNSKIEVSRLRTGVPVDVLQASSLVFLRRTWRLTSHRPSLVNASTSLLLKVPGRFSVENRVACSNCSLWASA